MKICCATTNAGKLREFCAANARLQQLGYEIVPYPCLGDVPVPEETGDTFEANAILKARHYAPFVEGSAVLAEDSGIAVDALDGAPGVLSARFSGSDATDASNNALLLERMAGVADRRARYVAVIALAIPGEDIHTFRGEVEGEILTQYRGDGGFGYDPLFYFPPFQQTFAEVSLHQKMSVSHRFRATLAMVEYLHRAKGNR